MKLFQRKKRDEGAQGKFRGQLQGKVGFWLRRVEIHLAEYLNQKTGSLSVRSWLVLLISFCLGVGGYLIYLLLGIFN